MTADEQNNELTINSSLQPNLLAELLRAAGLDAASFNNLEDAAQALLQRTHDLKQKSEELELYFTFSLDLLCIADIDGRFIHLNPEWENVLGHSVSELEGRMFLDFVHPDDVESTMAAVSKLERQEHVLDFVNRFRCKDGSYRWIEWRSRPLGRQIYAAARDITESKAMAEALQKSEETFRNIVQASPLGIYLYQLHNDDSLVFTGSNPAADRIIGFDHSTFVGKTIEQAFPPLQATEAPYRFRRAARHGENWHTEQIEYDYGGIAGAFEVHAFQMSPGNVAVMFSDITERKRTEAQLQQSEENLSRTLHSIGDGVIATDRKGRIVRMNPVAEKLCGWSESEARGRFLGETFRIVNAGTRELAEDPVQKVFALGQVVGLANHTLLLSKDGSEYQIADSASPIRDREGNITGAVLVFRDVTEEYAQAERLRISEERLDRAMAVKNEGIWDWNLATDEAFFDERYYTMAGYAPYEFPQDFTAWAERVHPEDLQNAASNIQAYLSGKLDNFDIEFRFKHKTGSWIWIRGRGKILERDADGAPLRMIGTHADITKRKQVEEALLESEEMQRRLLQTVPDLIVRTDLEGTIIFVNEMAFPGLENVPESSLSGKNIFSFIAPHDLPRAMENARTRLDKNIGPQEYQLVFENGAVVDTEVNGAVIRDRENRPLGMVFVIRDITERKRAEQKQEKLQNQLLQAQKMESLGTLAGGVAHDFNNLLQAMSGNMELLMRGKSMDHPDANRLKTVTRSMDRAAQLVQQLLFFSRKSGSRRVRVDLNQEIENVAMILERTIPKMIALELHLAPSLWPLFADPVQIEQILLNLAKNAVDAMPEGGRLIIETSNAELDEDFVRSHPGSTAGRYVLLSVSDTGCGMDGETLKHAFDPFFTTKEVGKGTGLGLASVYGIVQAHGGYILCYSESGHGTTFRVYLPFGEMNGAEDGKPQLETPIQGGSETILVVDDDQEIRDMTREVLESLGYAVQSAVTGEEALEAYKNLGKSIDLVLLDLNMPGMGGRKCLQELLQLDPGVKVIIVSGYTARGHGMDALSSGARGFIGKPYRFKELAAKLREVLDESR